jgi:hypothetical protein
VKVSINLWQLEVNRQKIVRGMAVLGWLWQRDVTDGTNSQTKNMPHRRQ